MLNIFTYHPFKGAALILGMLSASFGFADTVVIKNNQIISKPTTYKNVTLDLTQGNFTILSNGVLDIENSTIKIKISSANPFLAYVKNGALFLKNSKVEVLASTLTPTPSQATPYHLFKIDQGQVAIVQNTFVVDTPYTVNFLTTNPNYSTQGLAITQNRLSAFHGGLYLFNANAAEISYNTFENVSLTNVLNVGCSSTYTANLFSFPGNVYGGDAIDIINSNQVVVASNIIVSAANYGLLVVGSQNVSIDSNLISDGASYGIYIQAPTVALTSNKGLMLQLPKLKAALLINNNIAITNNSLILNHYGLAGEAVDALTVTDNTFVQQFSSYVDRQFWTNNDMLLATAVDVTWDANLYKEAYSQNNAADNSLSRAFISFPAHGGLTLPLG